MFFDIKKIRSSFPTLSESLAPSEIYFDNACTTLKPRPVVDAITDYLTNYPACHKRSTHDYGLRTSREIEKARESIKKFIDVPKTHELVFTKNSTEAINHLATFPSLGRKTKILLSDIEHNSNLLPWQRLVSSSDSSLLFVEIKADDTPEKIFDRFSVILQKDKPTLVTIPHTSHILGIHLPIVEITSLAHEVGALVHVDCSQALMHHSLSLREIGADFYSFSFHKALGPPGIGALVASRKSLDTAPPLLLGGETVIDTDYDGMTLSQIPDRFEAGTQNYIGILGAAAALNFLSKINREKANEHLQVITNILSKELGSLGRVRMLSANSGIVNFYIDGFDSGELAIMLNQSRKIMVRSGHLCSHAWYKKNRLPSTVRASLAFYNSTEEVETFVKIIKQLSRHF